MKMNSKVTGALAWTGLVLVLAVPAADMLSGKPEAKVNLASETTVAPAPAAADPISTASVETPAAPAASADPVQQFVKSGKKLPSYISGNPEPETETPVAARPTTPTVPVAKPAVEPEAEVATINPTLVAPVPLPASARPLPLPLAPEDPPLILDENTVASTGPLPPTDIVPDDQFVSGDDLDEWDSGSLAEYLERKGLISDNVSAQGPADSYDADGFYLDEGPNNDRRRSRVIVQDDDALFF